MAKVTSDTLIACPPLIIEKVRQFNEHLDTYTSGDYNEAQLRVDFLNPMIEALGWDVNNRKGYAEAYRDVVYEDAIKVGSTTKAPDYGFYNGGRIAGGGRKFFLEAKKPSVAIHVDPKPAFQLRRYAYSAQLPLSILTNFKEFIAYDTRYKPSPKDSATTAAVLRIKYTEYAERWHEIASVFSREAIPRGAFDKFATGKRKKGMEPLGDSFLKDIEGWRDLLAREIAKSNPDISVDDLNFAVQRTIDRILFLRICEDRGIETPGNLMQLLNGEKVYARLGKIFRGADDRYNSGIFHFPAAGKKPDSDRAEPPDDLTLSLTINDKPLKSIISGLYDTGKLFTTYAFAVIPPEILGHVYEQFLGKVIRLTPSHRVKIEPKPEVRKAGGVYYTPVYIVDYIVKNTVGKLLDGKSPKDAAKIRILDPASGSGSFLIGAYQFLLDWHLRWYLDNDPAKYCKGKNPALMRFHSPSLDGERDAPRTKSNSKHDYRLTTSKRKAILLNSIYGVDIDSQAVEVTKLSLLLKVLEGESQESVAAQMKFLHQRALPDLGRNIKCGNSLISDDFDDMELSEEERKKINKFNWKREFPTIFKTRGGGFDAVIGNPPYIRMEAFKELKDYLRAKYSSHDERSDLYVYFIEREHQLLRPGGMFGMIVSNKFIRAKYGGNLRALLSEVATIQRVVDLAGLPVFPSATVRTVVLITHKGDCDVPVIYSPPPSRDQFVELLGGASLESVTDTLAYALPQSALSTDVWNLAEAKYTAIIERLRANSQLLVAFAGGRICRGVVSGLTEAFVISWQKRSDILKSNPKACEIIRPFLQGRNIRRYRVETPEKYLIYTYHGIDMKPYPAVLDHLHPFKRKLEGRATKQQWYELQQPQLTYKELLEQPKIVFPDMAVGCRFAPDYDGHFGANTVYFLPTGNLALLGILNSRLAQFYFVHVCAALEGPGEAYLRFFGQYLEQFPVRKFNKAAHDRMVKLVDRMLDLHKKLAKAKSPLDKERIPRDIEATDRQIDKLVYELYSLTEEEIAIVEEATT